MGRDKADLRLGRRTLLGWVRRTALELGWPVRVIRRDSVPRCGPLGGIYTALQSTRTDVTLFLSCDMPFVSAELLEAVRARMTRRGTTAAFVGSDEGAGFPFVLRREALRTVEARLRARQYSIQGLAGALDATEVAWPTGRRHELLNVNTPADWARARLLLRRWSAKRRAQRIVATSRKRNLAEFS